MAGSFINITLKVWRQSIPDTQKEMGKGKFETYRAENIPTETSFLEMLDIVNNNLVKKEKNL